MKRILKEPLLHFLLLGGFLFAVYDFLNRAPETRPNEIVVSAGQIEHLTETFTRFQQRPPTAAELKEMADGLLRFARTADDPALLGLTQAFDAGQRARVA